MRALATPWQLWCKLAFWEKQQSPCFCFLVTAIPCHIFHSFIISARTGTTFCVVITAPVHTLAVIFLGVWMFSWPAFDKWSLLIFDECVSFSGGPGEGGACDDKRQGCLSARPVESYGFMGFDLASWEAAVLYVNRGLSVRTVSSVVKPGRHLHWKGHGETLVNKVLKLNHVMVTWHFKQV